MYRLTSTVGDMETCCLSNANAEHDQFENKHAFVIDRKTKVKFSRDCVGWRVFDYDKSEVRDGCIMIFIRPFKCSYKSKKFHALTLLVPVIGYRQISRVHRAANYRDNHGRLRTVIVTTTGPKTARYGKIPIPRVKEIFVN